VAVLNADDPTFSFFRQRAAGRVLTYGIETDADLRATELRADPGGTRFELDSPAWRGTVRIGLPGRFNVANALAALGAAHALGLDLEAAAGALSATAGVPGRMEPIDAGQPFGVVVDYAHTADSLGKVLEILRPLAVGRLIVVFGSAGERDRAKRPAMGRVAAERADLVVVTDEDPRLEDPRRINEEIAAGARAAGALDGESLWVIDDRGEAVRHAIGLARAGDIVLLAGKGHEASMIYGETKRPWDDREAARRALREAGYAAEA
jgi:UDP-N-acetylmuramoyl-L-alanyl-D-glutamate--2,6-diaminopimelate ligase